MNLNLLALLVACVGSTIAINPWSNYDPINLPKMLILTAFSFALIPIALRELIELKNGSVVLSLLFLICVLVVLTRPFLGGSPLTQQFWGTWGRNTGALTYFSFLVLLLAAIDLGKRRLESQVLVWFCKTTYFITFYTLIQFGEIDPINWSQKLPIATLGNINFMSALLGLANIVFLGKLLLGNLAWSSKFHFLFFFILNLFLIWQSGSIQGLAILLAGTWFLLVFRFSKSNFLRVSIFTTFPTLGFFGLLGTAAIGPLGNRIAQETVIFRIDYWKAGIQMFMDNTFFGIGIDSYGDYYRMYRDSIAATRTGPQRVTNTAHNVFLDLFSGGGLFVGIPFLALLLVLFFKLWSRVRIELQQAKSLTRFENSNLDLLILTALLPGWIVFLLISINQIGVAVWGFVFLGLAYGAASNKSLKTVKSDVSLSTGIFQTQFKSRVYLSSFLTGLVLSLPPVVTDIEFLNAIKVRDFSAMKASASNLGGTSFHWERLIMAANEDKRFSEAVQFSVEALRANPNNFQALATLSFTPLGIDNEQRKVAARRLSLLDPENLQLQNDLKGILGR